MMHGSVSISARSVRGDPLRGVRDEDLLADLEAAVLGEVAGYELRGPGRIVERSTSE